MMRGICSVALVAGGALVAPTSAGCAGGDWYDVYGGERCYNNGETMEVSCNDKWTGSSCGARLQHGGNMGVGQLSVAIKAAPGNGVITSFYLSNNGGMYAEGSSWSEIDFEIMGMQASGAGSRIWTNFFTGSGVEHHGYVSVPFDVSAAEHVYSFDVTPTTIRWLVDGQALRTEDITPYDDMKGAIAGNTFQGYISVWGKANSDPSLNACQEFMDGMGTLDDNGNGFPLHSTFRPVDGFGPPQRLLEVAPRDEPQAVIVDAPVPPSAEDLVPASGLQGFDMKPMKQASAVQSELRLAPVAVLIAPLLVAGVSLRHKYLLRLEVDESSQESDEDTEDFVEQ